MALGTLEQLRNYTPTNLRTAAARQSALLRQATRGERPAVPQKSITIRELNEQLSRLPVGHRGTSRFALRRKDGGIDFLELRRIDPGRYLLVQLHGAPGRFASRTLSVQLQHFAALHIAEDLAEAARLYGAEVKECGHCGSPLTNPESRRLGLGPKCRKHYGL